eukprot:COSAG02_NODE_25194_length_666_cov_0.917108_1_plen_68_part_00
MSASTSSVAHMFDYVSQTLLECIFGIAPSVRHLERIGLVDLHVELHIGAAEVGNLPAMSWTSCRENM